MEARVKELSLQDILVIAGGLPPGAALDEMFYRTPAEPLNDPMALADRAADEPPSGAGD
jgi:hypothetical protein